MKKLVSSFEQFEAQKIEKSETDKLNGGYKIDCSNDNGAKFEDWVDDESGEIKYYA